MSPKFLLRQAFDRATVAMAVTTPDGRVLESNAAFDAGARRAVQDLAGDGIARVDDAWLDVHAVPLGDDRVLWQVYDVTQLHDAADRDDLTGLANRRAFVRELGAHLARGRRYGLTGAVLLLDLDGFKAVNDSAGHAAGDALLVRVGDTLKAAPRASDVVARHGGDEFAVLLARADAARAQVVAAKLTAAIARL